MSPTAMRTACRRSGVMVIALITALLGLAMPATAAAAAPQGLTATGAPIPTLSWNRVPGATRYRIQGSENSSFSPLVFDLETTNNSYTPGRVLRSGTLYWQVLASDNTGPSGWSTSTATIGALTVPTNVAISPGQQVLPPVTPPIITWDAVPGAVSYEVEMDAEGDGVGGVVREVRSTRYVWSDPQGVGEREGTEDYFVRVRAKFEHQLQSDWTAYSPYNVTQLPSVKSETCSPGLVCAPHPQSGVRASTTVQDVVFDWDPVKGAKEYEIWVALDPDFNNQIDKRRILSTRYSPPTTYKNNTYYWKIRSYNAAGELLRSCIRPSRTPLPLATTSTTNGRLCGMPLATPWRSAATLHSPHRRSATPLRPHSLLAPEWVALPTKVPSPTGAFAPWTSPET